MRVELTPLQLEGLLSSIDAATNQINLSIFRSPEYSEFLENDLKIINNLKERISKINENEYIPITKFDIYLLINIASEYEDLHENPQDRIVKKIIRARMNILEVIKSSLPYINVILIKIINNEDDNE